MSLRNQIQSSHATDILEGDSHKKDSERSRLTIVKKIAWVSVLLCVISFFHAYLILIPLVVMLLLTVALLMIRLLQFTKRGDGFNHVLQLKFLVRSWICITTLSIIILTFIELPVCNIPDPPFFMSQLGSYIVCIYCLSCALPVIIHRLLPRIELDHNESGINVPEALSELINCLFYWLLDTQLMNDQDKLLGIFTWRWVEKAIFAIIGYNSIRLFNYGMVWLLKKVCRALDPGPRSNPHWYLLALDNLLPRKQVVYYANGMKSSIAFILTSMMLLLLWLLYFGKHLQLVYAEVVIDFGAWICISLLVCSVLWLIKTCVLLAWEANVVYERLESQILEARKQLYFLGLVGRHKHDIFKLQYRDNPPKNIFLRFCRSFFEVATPDIKYRSRTDKEDSWSTGEVKKLSSQKKKAVRDDLLMPKGHTPTMHDIKEVTLYLQEAKHALSNKNYAEDILCYLKSNNPSGDDHWVRVEYLKQLIIGQNNLNSIADDPKDQPSSAGTENNIQRSLGEIVEQSKINVQLSSEQTVLDIVQRSSEGILEAAENHVQSLSKEKEEKVRSSSGGTAQQTENNVQCSAPETENNDWKCFQEMLNNANPIVTSYDSSAGCHDARGSGAQDVNHGHASSMEEVISFEKIQIWTEMAQKKCLFLANAVSSGTELVDYLNTIISGVIIGATFIMWLLLTKLASTKVLVVIASPLVAASFIFGDTCKNLFQSIIFVYVLNPFDVGDLCDIHEDHKMEVKSIGVWKTTFSKTDEAGNQVEVIYPNSELANKKVINYKTELSVDRAVHGYVVST